MSRFYTFIIVTTILILSGCTSTPEVLLRADKYTDTNFDSALYLVEHIQPSILKTQRDSALYYLLLVKARNRCGLPFEPKDSVLNYSIAYFTKHPEGNRLAYCYLYKGRIERFNSNFDLATTFYLKALDVIEDRTDYTLLGYIAFDQGIVSLTQGDFDAARKKNINAYKFFTKAGNKRMAFYAKLGNGEIFFRAKQYQKALNYYRSIKPLVTDSMSVGDLYHDMAFDFYYFNKDSSLYYYRQALHYPCLWGTIANRYMMIGYIFYNQNKTDSAQYYLLKALEYPSRIYNRNDCYKLLTYTSYKLKNMDAMSDYMHRYLTLNDSINMVVKQPHGALMESLHISQEKTKETKSLNIFLDIAIGLVIIFSIIFFKWMYDRSKKEKQLADETHSQQKVKIRQDIIQSKREALQDKINRIKTVHEPDKKQYNVEEKEKKVWQMYDELLHISDLPFFYKEMDTVLNHLVTKLKDRYDKLNDKELCWCCLSLLDVPSYDMLILLNYNSDTSLKKMKTRLADKLHIENASGLSDFLNKILSED